MAFTHHYIWDEHATKKGRDYIPENEISNSQKDALLLHDERYVLMRAAGRTQKPYGELQLRREEAEPETVVVDDEPVVSPQTDEPTLADLESMTVAQLRELAAKDQVDLSGLTIKADIVGRMALHFGIEV